MEIRQLISFIAVAETGRVSSAAIRCNLTQGAISQQLRQLEEEFSIQLFIRTHKEMRLTEAGHIFLVFARNILHQVEMARDEIASLSGRMCGELRIGAGSIIEPFLGPAIAEFSNRYPDVRISIQYDYASVLNKRLRNHDLDIAFTINKSYASENITSIPCFRISLNAIMQDTHPLARKKSLTFSEIIQHRLMLPDVGIRETETLQQYANEDISPMLDAACCDTNNIHALLSAVKHVNVITMLPPEFALYSPHLIAVPVHSIERKLICYRHTMAHTPPKAVVTAFINILNELKILDIINHK